MDVVTASNRQHFHVPCRQQLMLERTPHQPASQSRGSSNRIVGTPSSLIRASLGERCIARVSASLAIDPGTSGVHHHII